MTSNRLEAFSDGVIAIIITIMVLELTVPHHEHERARHDAVGPALRVPQLRAELRLPRHLLEQPPPHALLTERVSGGVLWANMHLLFWLSLIPFATAWMGENDFARVPTAIYGAVLLMDAIAYYILQRASSTARARTPSWPAPSAAT